MYKATVATKQGSMQWAVLIFAQQSCWQDQEEEKADEPYHFEEHASAVVVTCC